jgi:hypothetical protein
LQAAITGRIKQIAIIQRRNLFKCIGTPSSKGHISL